MQYSLEHLKTIVYAKFGEWAGGGGAANRVYYQLGDSKIENILIEVYLWCYDIPKFLFPQPAERR